MIQQAFFGPLREPVHGHESIGDMNRREIFAIAPICALCLWIGVMPQPLLDTIRSDVDAVVELYDDVEPNQVASLHRVQTALLGNPQSKIRNPKSDSIP
jgi:NADH-quinone oxidoreductase subunit M